MMNTVSELANHVGLKSACETLDFPRATFYRNRKEAPCTSIKRPAPPLSLSQQERAYVLDILNSERFQDKSPYEVYPALLDEGMHCCSISTMYRILGAHDQVKERRKQVQRPAYTKPELLATGPNQLWSWDITKLKSVSKWTYFYLYVIIDVFSRYVVGWLVAHREQKSLASKMIEESCIKQNISPGQLTVHADRGSSMKSKEVAQLLCDLGVVKSHSRPHVSNDNPFSEAQFKTLKYSPEFPGTFGCIEDARAFCKDFFNWYNTCHYHTGIGMMIPEHLHYGTADAIFQNRSDTLLTAFNQHPERFKNKLPKPPALPEAVWINNPQKAVKLTDPIRA
jgi:putative transposase